MFKNNCTEINKSKNKNKKKRKKKKKKNNKKKKKKKKNDKWFVVRYNCSYLEQNAERKMSFQRLLKAQ